MNLPILCEFVSYCDVKPHYFGIKNPVGHIKLNHPEILKYRNFLWRNVAQFSANSKKTIGLLPDKLSTYAMPTPFQAVW